MATWNDVISNPEYAKETPETQMAIREEFFNKVIRPQVEQAGDDVSAVYQEFTSTHTIDTGTRPEEPVLGEMPEEESRRPDDPSFGWRPAQMVGQTSVDGVEYISAEEEERQAMEQVQRTLDSRDNPEQLIQDGFKADNKAAIAEEGKDYLADIKDAYYVDGSINPKSEQWKGMTGNEIERQQKADRKAGLIPEKGADGVPTRLEQIQLENVRERVLNDKGFKDKSQAEINKETLLRYAEEKGESIVDLAGMAFGPKGLGIKSLMKWAGMEGALRELAGETARQFPEQAGADLRYGEYLPGGDTNEGRVDTLDEKVDVVKSAKEVGKGAAFGATVGTALGVALKPFVKNVDTKEVDKYVKILTKEADELDKAMKNAKNATDVNQVLDDFNKGDYEKLASRKGSIDMIEEINPELAKNIRAAGGQGGFDPASIAKAEAAQEYLTKNKDEVENVVNLVSEKVKMDADRAVSSLDQSVTRTATLLDKGNLGQRIATDTAEMTGSSWLNRASKVIEDYTGGGASLARSSVNKQVSSKVANETSDLLRKYADEALNKASEVGIEKGSRTFHTKAMKELSEAAKTLDSKGSLTGSEVAKISKAISSDSKTPLVSQSDRSEILNNLGTLKSVEQMKEVGLKSQLSNTALSIAIGYATAGMSTVAQAALVAGRSVAQHGTKKQLMLAKKLHDELAKKAMTDKQIQGILERYNKNTVALMLSLTGVIGAQQDK